jgi:hypothetical protein
MMRQRHFAASQLSPPDAAFIAIIFSFSHTRLAFRHCISLFSLILSAPYAERLRRHFAIAATGFSAHRLSPISPRMIFIFAIFADIFIDTLFAAKSFPDFLSIIIGAFFRHIRH